MAESTNTYLNEVRESCAKVFNVSKEAVVITRDEKDNSFSVIMTDEEKLGTIYFITFTLLKDKSHFEIMLMRGKDFDIPNIMNEKGETPNTLYHQRIVIVTGDIKSVLKTDATIIGYGKFGVDKYEIANLYITEDADGVNITIYFNSQYHEIIKNAILYFTEEDGIAIDHKD